MEEANFNNYISDDIMTRTLIARENNEPKALEMWKVWLDWRLKYHPESITEESIQNELSKGKSFMHGFDKEGRPCIIIYNGKHIPEETDVDEFMRYMVYMVEKACKMADETGTKQICVIADRTNTGWKNFDRRLFGQMGLMRVLQDFYAERLHKVYVLHVNWVFRAIHKMVSPLMAKKTTSKVLIFFYP